MPRLNGSWCRRRICVVSRSVTRENFSEESCPFHSHIGWQELNTFHAEGSLQPVDGVRESAKDEDGREPDYVFEWLITGKVIRYKREIPYRGSSTKDGWYLAQELKKHKGWAVVAVAHTHPSRTKASKTKMRSSQREKMRVLEPGYERKETVDAKSKHRVENSKV